MFVTRFKLQIFVCLIENSLLYLYKITFESILVVFVFRAGILKELIFFPEFLRIMILFRGLIHRHAA